MSSLIPTVVAIAILGVVAYLIWSSRPTRESLRAKRAAAAGLDAEFFRTFEQQAVHIANSVFTAASQRLEQEAVRHGLPTSAELVGGDAEPLTTGAKLRGAARELVDATVERDRLRDTAFNTPEAERAEENWAYLNVAYADRYPLLVGFIDRGDLRSLERIASGPALDAARILRADLDSRLNSYAEIRANLQEEPEGIWSVLSLVVLALSRAELEDKQQSAVAARANAGSTDSWFTLVNTQLKGALHICHGIPPCDRVRHRGVLALPLEDRDLGAALVQYCANEATAQGELDQARVLTMGDSTILWLADDVVRVREYPEEAVRAFARLAPLVRQALAVDASEYEAAREAVEAALREELDEASQARVLSTIEKLRSGLSPEQARAATSGHEANAQ